MIKLALGESWIAQRNAELTAKALANWREHKSIEVLGNLDCPRLPIFSFRVRGSAGGHIHHQLITRLLSDQHGVQARGGCACAGPYAHRLLGLSREASEKLWTRLAEGHELEKPGWTRVNFSYLMSDENAARVIEAVADIATGAAELSADYECDAATARFRWRQAN